MAARTRLFPYVLCVSSLANLAECADVNPIDQCPFEDERIIPDQTDFPQVPVVGYVGGSLWDSTFSFADSDHVAPYDALVIGFVSVWASWHMGECNTTGAPWHGQMPNLVTAACARNGGGRMLYVPSCSSSIAYCGGCTDGSTAYDVLSYQRSGKRVLISVGGAVSDSNDMTAHGGSTLAESIWNLYLGGDDPWYAAWRPFGPHVVLDGVDLDLEQSPHDCPNGALCQGVMEGWSNFVVRLRQLMDADARKEYLITAVPINSKYADPTLAHPDYGSYTYGFLPGILYCDETWLQWPLETDSNARRSLDSSSRPANSVYKVMHLLDFLWPQFYPSPDDITLHGDCWQRDLMAWVHLAKDAAEKAGERNRCRVGIGLPVSSSAASAGYIAGAELHQKLLDAFVNYPHLPDFFGGIFGWDHYWDMTENPDDRWFVNVADMIHSMCIRDGSWGCSVSPTQDPLPSASSSQRPSYGPIGATTAFLSWEGIDASRFDPALFNDVITDGSAAMYFGHSPAAWVSINVPVSGVGHVVANVITLSGTPLMQLIKWNPSNHDQQIHIEQCVLERRMNELSIPSNPVGAYITVQFVLEQGDFVQLSYLKLHGEVLLDSNAGQLTGNVNNEAEDGDADRSTSHRTMLIAGLAGIPFVTILAYQHLKRTATKRQGSSRMNQPTIDPSSIEMNAHVTRNPRPSKSHIPKYPTPDGNLAHRAAVGPSAPTPRDPGQHCHSYHQRSRYPQFVSHNSGVARGGGRDRNSAPTSSSAASRALTMRGGQQGTGSSSTNYTSAGGIATAFVTAADVTNSPDDKTSYLPNSPDNKTSYGYPPPSGLGATHARATERQPPPPQLHEAQSGPQLQPTLASQSQPQPHTKSRSRSPDHRKCITCNGPSMHYCLLCRAAYCNVCNVDARVSGLAHVNLHSV